MPAKKIVVGDIVRLTDRSWGIGVFAGDGGEVSCGFPDDRLPCVDKLGNVDATNYEVQGVFGEGDFANMSGPFPLMGNPNTSRSLPEGESNTVILKSMVTGDIIITQVRFCVTGKILPKFPMVPGSASARRTFMANHHGL